MRVVDADQIHFMLASLTVGAQQIFGTQFVARGLRTSRRIVERECVNNGLCVAINGANHGATAFVRICSLRVIHHLAPGLSFNGNHDA